MMMMLLHPSCSHATLIATCIVTELTLRLVRSRIDYFDLVCVLEIQEMSVSQPFGRMTGFIGGTVILVSRRHQDLSIPKLLIIASRRYASLGS